MVDGYLDKCIHDNPPHGPEIDVITVTTSQGKKERGSEGCSNLPASLGSQAAESGLEPRAL